MSPNPLRWSSRHKVAAGIFIVLGLIGGSVIGGIIASGLAARYGLPANVASHVGARLMLTWGSIGAAFAALLVYGIQLFRD